MLLLSVYLTATRASAEHTKQPLFSKHKAERTSSPLSFCLSPYRIETEEAAICAHSTQLPRCQMHNGLCSYENSSKFTFGCCQFRHEKIWLRTTTTIVWLILIRKQASKPCKNFSNDFLHFIIARNFYARERILLQHSVLMSKFTLRSISFRHPKCISLNACSMLCCSRTHTLLCDCYRSNRFVYNHLTRVV